MPAGGSQARGRLPLFSTLVVGLAVATMIALGIWQLGRRAEKDALLRRYEAVASQAPVVPWPSGTSAVESSLYRRSAVECTTVLARETLAGTARTGAKGWAHRVLCGLPDGSEARVALGWSRAVDAPPFAGGQVTGVIGPGPVLYADPAQAGLEPLARPDPRDLPNNHLAYAVQWFFFAASAVAVYWLALRGRSRDRTRT